MCCKNPVGLISCILLVIGGLNWGLVGLGGFIGSNTNLNVVNLLLGQWPQVEWIVYLLVGISAIVHVVLCMKGCKCSTEKK
jgi:uncharacterized protein